MRDKMLIYSNFEDLKKKCEACLKRDHDIFNCPQIHYVPRKNFIIMRHQYSKPKLEREIFKRSTRKSFKALRDLKLLNQKFLRLESSAMQQEQINNEDVSNYEFSEDEFIEMTDSPASSNLKKAQSNDFRTSLVIKSINEDSFQKTVEDEKEKEISSEDEPGSKEEAKRRKKKEHVLDSNNNPNHQQIS